MFWNVASYVTLAIVVIGSWWRYRYDNIGWTTRSSQRYEARILRIASPMFHFGILVVVVGHVIGLVIPESWTDAVGLSNEAYHEQAVVLGSIAGVTTLAGIALFVYRRRTRGPVFLATTANDKLMYVVLVLAIVAGLCADRLPVPALHRLPQPRAGRRDRSGGAGDECQLPLQLGTNASAATPAAGRTVAAWSN